MVVFFGDAGAGRVLFHVPGRGGCGFRGARAGRFFFIVGTGRFFFGAGADRMFFLSPGRDGAVVLASARVVLPRTFCRPTIFSFLYWILLGYDEGVTNHTQVAVWVYVRLHRGRG